jgi:hypothetical protein
MSFKFGASTAGTASSSIGNGGGLYAGISLGGSNSDKKTTAEEESNDKSTSDPSKPVATVNHPNIPNSNDAQNSHPTDSNIVKEDTKKDEDKSKGELKRPFITITPKSVPPSVLLQLLLASPFDTLIHP